MRNFPEQFESVVSRFADRTAVEVQRREAVDRYTYAELQRMALAAGGWLASHGVEPGDRCALLADNDAHWCGAYLGTLRIGAVAVPLDTSYSARQVSTLVADCGARVLFTTPRHLETARAAVAGGVPCALVLLHGAAEGDTAFETLAGAGAPDRPAVPPCPAGPEDTAVILYTSGTTSDPKGVMLTHGNLLAEQHAVFQVVRVDEHDCVLGVLPLFHALAQMANLLLPFSLGARVVFLETVNTTELLRALDERQVTAFCCVPQFFYLIHQRVMTEVGKRGAVARAVFAGLLGLNRQARRAGVNLGPALFGRVHRVLGGRMRLLITGGSRFDERIGEDLFALGFTIIQAYGLTECSGAATVTRPGEPVHSVGPPLPGVEIRVAAADTAADGQADGEVLVRGPIVMKGYFNRPDATAEAIRDGWLHTGDLGRLDPRGALSITGRRKEIIVTSSGKNLYPEEIEAHYRQSPFVRELCVLGVARPGEPAAERLHAVVVPDVDVLRERRIVNTTDLVRFELEGLSVSLPPHKRVLGFDVTLQPLPRTTTGKLRRFAIQREWEPRVVSGAPREVAGDTGEEVAWASDAHAARALGIICGFAKPGAPVRAEANLELDLGLDSMERVELLSALERSFGVRVDEQQAHTVFTVRQLVEVVRPAAGGAATPRDEDTGWARLLAEVPAATPALRRLVATRRLVTPVVFVVLRTIVWLLARPRASGRQHLPASGPYIISPNHQSYLDPFILCATLPYRAVRDLFFVGAAEYFQTPLTRWLAALLNVVPVDPDANLLPAMQAGAFGLQHGKVLMLFPEGERSIDGTVRKFRKGAAILAHHLQVPIVPVAIDGVFEIWPRRQPLAWTRLLPWTRKTARIAFGAPIVAAPVPAGRVDGTNAGATHAAVTDRVRGAVQEMWDRLHGGGQ